MKTFPAYNVDPAKLFSALKSAGQPVEAIRFRGSMRKNVALACVCVGNSANDAVCKRVISGQSGPKPNFSQADDHIAALGDGIGKKLVEHKG